ncbi:conserved hypothetical protein, partial [Ricinus communis]
FRHANDSGLRRYFARGIAGAIADQSGGARRPALSGNRAGAAGIAEYTGREFRLFQFVIAPGSTPGSAVYGGRMKALARGGSDDSQNFRSRGFALVAGGSASRGQ